MPEEKETGRLEAFSDGVLAIAITFGAAFFSAPVSVGLCLFMALFFAFRGRVA